MSSTLLIGLQHGSCLRCDGKLEREVLALVDGRLSNGTLSYLLGNNIVVALDGSITTQFGGVLHLIDIAGNGTGNGWVEIFDSLF